jgi:hypothetical protein
MARSQQTTGATAEGMAAQVMAFCGVKRLQRMHTGTRQIRGKRIFAERVFADFHGLLPGGRMVVCECKARQHLVRSDFAAHQIEALDEYAALGALALLFWFKCGTNQYWLMEWQCVPWTDRGGIDEAALSSDCVIACRERHKKLS